MCASVVSYVALVCYLFLSFLSFRLYVLRGGGGEDEGHVRRVCDIISCVSSLRPGRVGERGAVLPDCGITWVFSLIFYVSKCTKVTTPFWCLWVG